MNVLGHAFVAERWRPGDRGHTLGAVLPDLASMAGVRLAGVGVDAWPALADGVRCHHAADAAFHSQRAFIAGAAALRRDLLAAGIAKGPARAVAHVGFELLLDGVLVGTDTEGAYRAAADRDLLLSVTDAIATAGRARWRVFVDRYSPPPPIRYDDPAWVAERLVMLLAHRPRLALGRDDVPAVTAALEHHAAGVRAAAPGILGALGG